MYQCIMHLKLKFASSVTSISIVVFRKDDIGFTLAKKIEMKPEFSSS